MDIINSPYNNIIRRLCVSSTTLQMGYGPNPVHCQSSDAFDWGL